MGVEDVLSNNNDASKHGQVGVEGMNPECVAICEVQK
jgi:hypothetical protein